MPLGWYYRRRPFNGFQLELGGKGKQSSMVAYQWLTWKELELGVPIVHEYSCGYEYRVGTRKLPVDGFVKSQNLVLEFHG